MLVARASLRFPIGLRRTYELLRVMLRIRKRTHVRCQVIGRVIIENWDCSLQNDRAVIVFIVDKMDGTTAEFHAPFQDRLVNMMSMKAFAAERRDRVTGEY